MVKNNEIAEIFYEIAVYLEMDDVSFRSIAYQKAADSLILLEEDVEKIYKKRGINGLKDIQGVGKSIAFLIKEYLEKGKIGYYEQLKKKIPVDVKTLMKIEGIGPKTIKTLYKELNIKNLKELEKAAVNQKISALFNFDKKSEENILESVSFLKESKDKLFLGDILFEARKLEQKINLISGVEKVNIAGSLRRRKETIRDIDFLISSNNPKKIINFLKSLPDKKKIIGQGKTKISMKTKKGYNVDFRIVRPESYGAALQYFTGSKEHNILLRRKAIKKGLKVNEYGVFKNKKNLGGKTEKEVYNLIGTSLVPPELREGRKELEVYSQKKSKKIPELVAVDDIKGDIHCHSTWSGGENTIQEMAREAIKMGYKYIGIADHTQFLKIENGLDEKELIEQRKEIKKLNSKLKNSKFVILQGCEANILKDGSLDIKNSVLKKLDFVIAGIHSHFKMNKGEMTERIIKAMENKFVDVISHPTGRILGKRKEYEVDFEKILKTAKETNTVLEINAYPKRLDLNYVNIKKAKDAGVKMVINTDSHHKSQLKFMELGVSQAKRGWAEKKDIINCKDNLLFK